MQFTAPVTGSYTFRVTRFSSAVGWPGTFLGTAWSVRSLPTQCTGATTVPSSGANLASVNNAPAGRYWLIVDGGAVGTTNVTISVTGP